MTKILHCDEVKKVRRKIEEKLRQDLTEDQIIGLAQLLQINSAPQNNNLKKKE